MKITMKDINIIALPLVLGTCGYITYDVIKDTQNYRSVFDIQKAIKQKDPHRYDSLMNNTKIRRSYMDWAYEEKIMNDSIKTDSMVKRAYFEGAQMVRDSIQNAENLK